MLDTTTQKTIKVSLVTDEAALWELEKYLDVNYNGWRYVGEAFSWAYMTIAAIMLPQAAWTDEDTDVFDVLQQERLLRSYDWSYATQQELAMSTPGQIIPVLLGALAGLVGSDGYLTQREACVCDDTHRRNNTVCCVCYARWIYGCYQKDYQHTLLSYNRKSVYMLPYGAVHHGTRCQCEDCDTEGDAYQVAIFDVTHWNVSHMRDVIPEMLNELMREGTLPTAILAAASEHTALFKAIRHCLQQGWSPLQFDGHVPSTVVDQELGQVDNKGESMQCSVEKTTELVQAAFLIDHIGGARSW